MMRLFEQAASRHEAIVKEAFLGEVLKGGAKLLGAVVKRPGLAANVAFSAPDALAGARRGVAAVAKPGAMPHIGPTF